MKSHIHNNIMKASDLMILAVDKIPEVAVLRDVKLTYQQDAEGNRTDKITNVRYECVDMETFSNFTIKVNETKPIISPEALEQAEELVYIDIPVTETLIKPYAIEYGNVKISIIAPRVKLHKNS